MRDLADFFERMNEVDVEAVGRTDARELVDDDVVDERGDLLGPTFRQRAARAGVGLEELVAVCQQVSDGTVTGIYHRIQAGHDVQTDLMNLAVSAGMYFFLAGVLWEQDRQMPDYDWSGQ